VIQLSGAQVVAAYLQSLGLVQSSSQSEDWWVTVGAKTTQPAEAVAVYDTAGVKDGRLMETGEEIVHPGVQVLVRSGGYTRGWRKVVAIQNALSLALNNEVVVGLEAVTLVAFSLTSPPSHVGQEQDQPRQLFTMNGTLTLR
jgi:autotransporter adhesin